MNEITPHVSKLESFYSRLARGRIVLIFGVFYVLNQAALMAMFSRQGTDPLILQITMSKDVFMDVLTRWGADGVTRYLTHFCLDGYHPILYSVFLASAIALLSKRPGLPPSGSIKIFFVLPFIAGLCDVIENILHILMLTGFMDITGASVAISGSITNTKWFLAFVSIIAICVLGVKKLASKKERPVNEV